MDKNSIYTYLVQHNYSKVMEHINTLSNISADDPILEAIHQIFMEISIYDKIDTSHSIYYCFRDTHKIELLLLYCNILSKLKNIIYIGIDFEFNGKQLGLMQICIFHDKHKHAVLCRPELEFSKDQQDRFIKCFYLNKQFRFILHGSDSLDMPYIYSIFRHKYHNDFSQFLSRTYDTRFLCEFNKFAKHHADFKCSLYVALLYANAISQSEYENLHKIEHKLYPMYKINWHIINQYIINYAVHDVIHLYDLFHNLITPHILSNENTYLIIMDIYHLMILLRCTKLINPTLVHPHKKIDKDIHNKELMEILYKISTFKTAMTYLDHMSKEEIIILGKQYKLNYLEKLYE